MSLFVFIIEYLIYTRITYDSSYSYSEYLLDGRIVSVCNCKVDE